MKRYDGFIDGEYLPGHYVLYTDHLAARAQDRERIEALEWLVEAQALWGNITVAHLWDEITDAGGKEYYAILNAARAAAGV